MHDEEPAKRKAIRRSVFLQKDAVAGTCLRDAVIEYRRPGYGLTPAEYERFADAVLREDLPAGACLSLSDLTMAPEEAKVN